MSSIIKETNQPKINESDLIQVVPNLTLSKKSTLRKTQNLIQKILHKEYEKNSILEEYSQNPIMTR